MADENRLEDELSIARGTLFGVVGTVIGTGIGFATNVLLARHLEADGYGVWTLGLLLLNITVMVSVLGLKQGLPRFVGKHRGKSDTSALSHTVTTGLLVATIVAGFSSLLLYFLARPIAGLLETPVLSSVLRILSWAVLPSAVLTVLYAVLQGFENIRDITLLRSIVSRVLWLVFVAVLVYELLSDRSPVFIAAGYLLVQILTLGLAAIWIDRQTNYEAFLNDFDVESLLLEGRRLLVFSTPLMFSGISTFVWQQSDKFLLGYFLTASTVGLYSVAYRIAQITPLFFTSIGRVFMPNVSKSLEDLEYMRTSFYRASKWGLALTVLVMLPLYAFPRLLLVLFGPDFAGSTVLLRALILVFFAQVIWGPNGHLLTVLGESRFVFIYTATGGVTNIIFNVLLIPEYGSIGAAIATGIGLVCMNGIAASRLYYEYRVTPFSRGYSLYIAVVVVTFAAISWNITSPLSVGNATLLCGFLLLQAISAIVLLMNDRDAELIKYLYTNLLRSAIK